MHAFENEAQSLQALPPERQIAPLARAMDLDTFFARRGLPESRFNQCLGDGQAVQQLTDQTNRAVSELQVQGTPTFFINGERVRMVRRRGATARGDRRLN